MLCRVSANVSIESAVINKVKRNPQQLEVYGSAISIGLAPNTSNNFITEERQETNFCLKFLCFLNLFFE